MRLLLKKDVGSIRCDPAQVERMLLNLTVNARDAMPNGGTLTIATEVCHLDGRIQPWWQASSNSEHVLLTVSDTGQGIPADAIPRIFQPFYTTKPEGKGTGLELATVVAW